MERRSVHHSPPPFTTDTPDQPFRSHESARVHHRSLRTVTSLVTSRPPGRRSSPEIRAGHRAVERIYRDYAGVRFPASRHAGTWADERAGPDHPRRTAIRACAPVTSRRRAQCTPAVPGRTPAAQATGPRGARPRSAGTSGPRHESPARGTNIPDLPGSGRDPGADRSGPAMTASRAACR
jgi:hypothetical protein